MTAVPPALLPYQQRWLTDKSPVKVMEKSRRVGLSWAEAADSSLLAASRAGMDVWYIGYNKEMAQEFIRDCAFWAGHYQLAASQIEERAEVFQDGDEKKSVLSYIIRFDSGFRVTALSSRPSNLRGKQGRAIIDEAAFHDDLPELLKAALAFLMWGGQVFVISTHNGDSNPFNELISEIRGGKKPYALHRVTLDDALSDGLFRRICLVKGEAWSEAREAAWRQSVVASYGDAADEELFCIPQGGGGKYFSRVLLEQRMSAETPVVRYALSDDFATWPEHLQEAEVREWCEAHLLPLLKRIPADARSFFGEDFGRSGDLTVIAPLIQTQGLQRRPPLLVELRNVPFRRQEQILFYLVDRLPNLLGGAMDARGNGQYLAEVAAMKYGASRVQQVMLTEGWYREWMPKLKSALEDGSLDGLPQDADVLDDLRAFEVIKGVARLPETRQTEKGADGGGEKGKKNKRHGDAGVAYALVWFAAQEVNKGSVTVKSRRPRKARQLTQGYGRGLFA